MINNNTSQADSQYSVVKIIGIWATVSLPMPVLAFVITPALAPHTYLHRGILLWLLLIIGMVWQFIVSLWLLYRELGTLNWTAVRERVWLNKPRDPKTNETKASLFWWLIPAALFILFIQFGLGDLLTSVTTRLLPFLSKLPNTELDQLASAEFVGVWWLVGIALISNVFNYFLGEELLFRGVLLPKMQGAFGQWDWVTNAVLFGLYHLHKPLSIPVIMLSSLAYTWTSRRFHSNWFAIILHGFEGLFLLALVLMVVTGAAF